MYERPSETEREKARKRTTERMNERTNERANERIDEQMKQLASEQASEQANERTNARAIQCLAHIVVSVKAHKRVQYSIMLRCIHHSTLWRMNCINSFSFQSL